MRRGGLTLKRVEAIMPVEFIKITPGKMRRVKIIASTRVLGTHVEEGEEPEIPESEAFALVHMGKAEFYVEPVKARK